MIVIKNVTINRDNVIRGTIEPNLVDLSFYARDNILDYHIVSEIPKEHMDYINSVKYAGNCEYMFYDCCSLITLDLSNFNTSYVTNMNNMFEECNLLTTIKGTLDLSSCENVDSMFETSTDIKGVHLKNVPRSLLDTNGYLKGAGGTLNETYIIDNILEG